MREALGRRAMGRFACAVGIVAALAGCASVADDPTVPAFAIVASQAKSTFETARDGEADAFLGQAIFQASGSGSFTTEHCIVVAEAADCHIIIKVDGNTIDTGAVGPNLAKDADKLTSYAKDLEDLAAAKDLDDQKAALRKFSTSVGGVFQAAGVPGIGAVGALVAELVEKAQLTHRREELLKIALKADEAVQPLGDKLQATTLLLQSNIVTARSQIVTDIQARLLALPANDPRRPVVARQLINAARSERQAANLEVDFSALGKAHRKMIESLRTPKGDLKGAIDEFTTLDKDFEAVRTALSPSTAKVDS